MKNRNTYTQEQNQALFTEYFESLWSCVVGNGNDALATLFIDKLHGFCGAEYPNAAVISSSQIASLRTLFMRVEKKLGYPYNVETVANLKALESYAPTYVSSWGLAECSYDPFRV